MLNRSEADIIRDAQQGDNTAITELYEQHYLGVYRFLYYRVNNQQVAEDLTSDVFVRMIDSLPKYEKQDASFRAWLFQIARNLSIDYYRKMAIRNHSPLEENLVAKAEDIGLVIDQRLTSQNLRLALAQLTDDQRDVIVLRFVAGLPISEVAQLMKKSDDAVKGLQRRALNTLRDVQADGQVRPLEFRIGVSAGGDGMFGRADRDDRF
jgi:RNA polymerase sigma-70 factor (ECF subfamily)